MANTNATDLLALIWSCLAHEDPSLSIEQVGNMLTPAVVETIQQSILEAQNISGANEEKSDSAAPGQLKQE
jgi:hypothetical protein